jgi:response regulator NasT
MQSVLLLTKDARHGASLRAVLESLRYRIVDEIADVSRLHAEVLRLAPDLVIVSTDSPSQEMLEDLRSLSEASPRPVIIFASDPSRDVIRNAVAAGVAAYVVDGWAPERVTPIIDAACARFEAYASIKRELAATQNKLSERKVIEKAKGIVMQQRGLTEDQAYTTLRKMAMDQNLALAEVARRVIALAQLFA